MGRKKIYNYGMERCMRIKKQGLRERGERRKQKEGEGCLQKG
jgi:hypothetical protein